MSFTWPIALVLLVIVPVLALLYAWFQTRRRKYALRYASTSLVAAAVGRGPGVRRHIPAALYLLALTAMIVALARPRASVPVPQNTGTVILSIDVSGSMLAEDVKPDRMEATKQAVREFVQKQPAGVKIGIVSFSDFAALVAPPSRDRQPVLDAISRLRARGGTNIGAGLQVALDAIYDDVDAGRNQSPVGGSGGFGIAPTPTPVPVTNGKAPPASIVLISDGQSNTGPQPERIATEAADAGVKVYPVGIGTSQGTVLQIQGRSVFTRLDEDTLRSVAEQTKGRYFNAQDESDLKQIYDELSRERRIEKKEMEVTFALTGAALLLSIVAGGLGLLWFNRLP